MVLVTLVGWVGDVGQGYLGNPVARETIPYNQQCLFYEMWANQDTVRRPFETSPSDGVNCTHRGCVGNLLYKVALIISNSVYFSQCRAFKIQSGDCMRHH